MTGLRASLALILVWFCLGLSSIYGAVAFNIAAAFSARFKSTGYRSSWNALFQNAGWDILATLRAILDVSLVREGTVPEGRHIVVVNHQSTLDVPFLVCALHPLNLKFVAKKALGRRLVPVVARYLRKGHGLVDFDDPRSTIRGLRLFARNLAAWEGSPLIFPEGIRSRDGSVSTFQGAGLRLLVRETGLPVLPVVIDGLWRCRSLGRFFMNLQGTRCRVRVLAPIPAEEARENEEHLAARLERTIRAELESVRRSPPQTDPR